MMLFGPVNFLLLACLSRHEFLSSAIRAYALTNAPGVSFRRHRERSRTPHEKATDDTMKKEVEDLVVEMEQETEKGQIEHEDLQKHDELSIAIEGKTENSSQPPNASVPGEPDTPLEEASSAGNTKAAVDESSPLGIRQQAAAAGQASLQVGSARQKGAVGQTAPQAELADEGEDSGDVVEEDETIDQEEEESEEETDEESDEEVKEQRRKEIELYRDLMNSRQALAASRILASRRKMIQLKAEEEYRAYYDSERAKQHLAQVRAEMALQVAQEELKVDEDREEKDGKEDKEVKEVEEHKENSKDEMERLSQVEGHAYFIKTHEIEQVSVDHEDEAQDSRLAGETVIEHEVATKEDAKLESLSARLAKVFQHAVEEEEEKKEEEEERADAEGKDSNAEENDVEDQDEEDDEDLESEESEEEDEDPVQAELERQRAEQELKRQLERKQDLARQRAEIVAIAKQRAEELKLHREQQQELAKKRALELAYARMKEKDQVKNALDGISREPRRRASEQTQDDKAKRIAELGSEAICSKGNNIYIKNLDENTDDYKLYEMFAPFGIITSAVAEKNTKGLCKGFGFVCFLAPEQATRAVIEMHMSVHNGKAIFVNLAETREQRDERLRTVEPRKENVGPDGYPIAGKVGRTAREEEELQGGKFEERIKRVFEEAKRRRNENEGTDAAEAAGAKAKGRSTNTTSSGFSGAQRSLRKSSSDSHIGADEEPKAPVVRSDEKEHPKDLKPDGLRSALEMEFTIREAKKKQDEASKMLSILFAQLRNIAFKAGAEWIRLPIWNERKYYYYNAHTGEVQSRPVGKWYNGENAVNYKLVQQVQENLALSTEIIFQARRQQSPLAPGSW